MLPICGLSSTPSTFTFYANAKAFRLYVSTYLSQYAKWTSSCSFSLSFHALSRPLFRARIRFIWQKKKRGRATFDCYLQPFRQPLLSNGTIVPTLPSELQLLWRSSSLIWTKQAADGGARAWEETSMLASKILTASNSPHSLLERVLLLLLEW